MVYSNSNSLQNFTAMSPFPCKPLFVKQYPTDLGVTYYLPLIIIVIIIGLSAAVLNGAFLFVVFKTRALQTIHNILLISLSISDFLTGVIVMPFHAIVLTLLIHQKFSCDVFWIWARFFDCVAVVSLLTLTLISFEKYLAIMHPLYYQQIMTKRKIVIMALEIWILGVIESSVLQVVSLSHPNIYKRILVYFPYVVFFFYIVIILIHVRVLKEIHKVRRTIAITNTYQNEHGTVRQNSKAAKMTVIIVAALTACYIPLNIIYILLTHDTNLGLSGKLELFMELTAHVVVLFNSTLNPIVYYARMSLVRQAFQRIFCGGELAYV